MSSDSDMNEISSMTRILHLFHSSICSGSMLADLSPEAVTIVLPPKADVAAPVYAV